MVEKGVWNIRTKRENHKERLVKLKGGHKLWLKTKNLFPELSRPARLEKDGVRRRKADRPLTCLRMGKAINQS